MQRCIRPQNSCSRPRRYRRSLPVIRAQPCLRRPFKMDQFPRNLSVFMVLPGYSDPGGSPRIRMDFPPRLQSECQANGPVHALKRPGFPRPPAEAACILPSRRAICGMFGRSRREPTAHSCRKSGPEAQSPLPRPLARHRLNERRSGRLSGIRQRTSERLGRTGPQWKGNIMLSWALTFFVVALIAGVLGFGGVAGTAAWIAKICFVIFIVLFLVSLISGRRRV